MNFESHMSFEDDKSRPLCSNDQSSSGSLQEYVKDVYRKIRLGQSDSLIRGVQHYLKRYQLSEWHCAYVISQAYERAKKKGITLKTDQEWPQILRRIAFNVVRELSREENRGKVRLQTQRFYEDFHVSKAYSSLRELELELENTFQSLDITDAEDRLILQRRAEGYKFDEIAQEISGIEGADSDSKAENRIRKKSSRIQQKNRDKRDRF